MMDMLFILLGVGLIVGLSVFAAYIDFSSQKQSIRYGTNSFDRERHCTNLTILKILADYAAQNPSQRFGQILRNTGVLLDIGVKDSSQEDYETPDYYISRDVIFEEPQVTLSRIEKVLANEYDYDIVIKVKKK